MRPQDILKYELIGLTIKVTGARNPSIIGMRGTIVHETRNTLKVRTDAGEKTLVKNQVTLATNVNSMAVEVDGALLVGRPEERLKKKHKP